jgi:undecaprenyl-diphosphatase
MNSIIVFLGEYLGHIMLGGLLVFWWEHRTRYPRFLLEVFFTALLSRGIITELIRFFWEKPRPFVEQNIAPLIDHAASSSFPSGHATLFFALSTILFFYNKTAGIVFLLGAVILSVARVFAFLHWPIDIIAGAFIGIASALLVLKVSQRFFRIN